MSSTKQCAEIRGERGSIPLSILVAIVAGGLVTTVVAVTLAGERGTRFDERFTSAVHVAEEGAQEALHRLHTGQLNPGDDGSGEVQGHEYRWETTAYIEDEEGELEPVEGDFASLPIEERDVVWWGIISEGTVGDVTRRVELDIEVLPLFDLAAFTDQIMDLGGTNVADSYNSGASAPDGQTDQFKAWCTGVGRLGTNETTGGFDGGGQAVCPYRDQDGNLDWSNDDITNDGVDLFNWENAPDVERCEQTPPGPGGSANNCWWDSDEARFVTHDEYRTTEPDLDWLEAELDDCGSLEDYVVSEDADPSGDHYVIEPASSATHPELPWAAGIHYYCVSSVDFDADTVIDGDLTDPVVFLTDGPVAVTSGHTIVNCLTEDGNLCPSGNHIDPPDDFDPNTGHGDDAVFPDAGALQIYSSAEAGTVFNVRQQSVMAAAVYTPRGACDGGAGVDLFGSLICGEMDNVGNWRFHYDEALRDLRARPQYRVDAWRETSGDDA